MTERPDSPEIEILQEVKRPLIVSSGPISRLTTDSSTLQSENGKMPMLTASANYNSAQASFAVTRELYRRQRQDARERGFTTGSSEDRIYAQTVSGNNTTVISRPTQSFSSIPGKTTLSSSGKPQAIVQPICNTAREGGTLIPLFGGVPTPRTAAGLSNVSTSTRVNDHVYQASVRAAAFAASVAQSFGSSATPSLSNVARLHQSATLPHANVRILHADVTVERSAPATASLPKTSVSVSERNVRPINLHDLLPSPSSVPSSTPSNFSSSTLSKPRATKIVTQFTKNNSVDRSVAAVLNSVRRQSVPSADPKFRPTLPPEKYYWRSVAYLGPEEEEEEYKGRFQCEWDGCDAVLPSNVSFVNHLLAHFLKCPIKSMHASETSSDVSLADFCRCHFCFSVFHSPFELQSHLLVVHSSMTSRLDKPTRVACLATCYICEKGFPGIASLQHHMTSVHERPDAPYWCRKCRFRSSLHQDVMYHFVKEHHGTLTLMCPLCLWMMDARLPFSNSRTTVITVTDFVKHIQMHDERQSENLACGRCLLTFAREADLVRHKVQHSKISNKPDVVQILLAAGVPKSLAKAERREFPCRRLVRAAVRTLTLSEGVCIECRQPMDSEAHYRPAPVSCMVCPFVTTCNNSYENHVCDHARGSEATPSNVFHRTEPLLLSLGTCACGFSTVRGNILAAHVALCVDSFDMVTLQQSVKEVPDVGPRPPAPLLTLKHLRLKPTSPELLVQWAKPLVNEEDNAYTQKIEQELSLRATEWKSQSSSPSSSMSSGSTSPPPQLIRSLTSPPRISAKKRPLTDFVEEAKPKQTSQPSPKTPKLREEDVFLPKHSTANETGAYYREIRYKGDSAAALAIALRDKSHSLSVLLETSNDLNIDDLTAAVEHAVIANVITDLVALVSQDSKPTIKDVVDSQPAVDDQEDVVNFDDFLSQLDPDQLTGNVFDKLHTRDNVIY